MIVLGEIINYKFGLNITFYELDYTQNMQINDFFFDTNFLNYFKSTLR